MNNIHLAKKLSQSGCYLEDGKWSKFSQTKASFKIINCSEKYYQIIEMETFETSELNNNSHIRISKVKQYKTL